MSNFIVEPHFRLQEWVAEEKGYFGDECLEYEFREFIKSTDGKHHEKGDKVGAFQSIEGGREADVSCACHWTVNVAASVGNVKLFADACSVTPSAIFVWTDSPIKRPADLAGVPISVGYQSGSHYSTIQALEQYMPSDQINLSFEEGMLFARMQLLLEGKIPAAALFSSPYYFAEQLGYRKPIDTSFMIAAMINGTPEPEDVRKYFRAVDGLLHPGVGSDASNSIRLHRSNLWRSEGSEGHPGMACRHHAQNRQHRIRAAAEAGV